MVWTPAASLVEDGTGKSTAVVWEQPSVGITWLNSRQKTAFSGASDALQEQYAQEAVEEISDLLVEMGFDAPPTDATQSLIWPARGAYRHDGLMWDSDELPAPLLEAVRLAEEEMAAGDWMPGAEAGAISSESVDGASVTYTGAMDPAGLRSNHPEIYRRLRRCLPP